jgi:hypothetical protein
MLRINPVHTSGTLQLRALFLAGCCTLLFGGPPVHAFEGSDGITAVASKASSDYKRARLPDGTFQPEFYSFGKGGNWGGEIKDPTIDKLSFLDVAHVIAVPLAGQKYFPARDPNKTRLLIMVYWGTTAVPGPSSDSIALSQFQAAQDNLNQFLISSSVDIRQKTVGGGAQADAAIAQWSEAAQMLTVENHVRDRSDFANALLLGYDSPGFIGTEYGNYVRGTPLSVERDDLYNEIEENRYFVVLMAYDFQLVWKQKKHKLLWETRFSIRERDHQFDRDLPAMAQYASQYFGQDSHGLIRKEVPLGHVEIGELKSLGEAQEIPATPVPAK